MNHINENKYTVLASNSEQAFAAIEANPYRLYLEYVPDNFDKIKRIIKAVGGNVKIFMAVPPNNDDLLTQLKTTAIDGYLVRTYGHLQKLEDLGSKKEIALDYSFNVLNSRTFARLAEYASSICLSPELGTAEINPAALTFLDWAISDEAMAIYNQAFPIIATGEGGSYYGFEGQNPVDQLIEKDFVWIATNRDAILEAWDLRFGG